METIAMETIAMEIAMETVAMDQSVQSARLGPLPPDPALRDELEATGKSLGFVPNSLLIMQRQPKLVRAWVQMLAAV